MVIASLAAASPGGGVIEGTVRSASGSPIANAKITVQDPAGRLVASGVSDARGRFEIKDVAEGADQVVVDCPGYAEYRKLGVSPGRTPAIVITLSKGRASPREPAAANPLGEVGFYDNLRPRAGELTNPTAGGGYNDAASAQGSQMIQQYLGGVSPAKPGAALPGTASGESQSRYERRGAALLAAHNYRGARALYTEGVARYSGSAQLRMGLGISLYEQGQYQQAAAALEQAARLAPDDAAPRVLLAEAVRFAPESIPAASAVLAGFVSRHPKSATGHYAYGLALWDGFRSTHDEHRRARAQSELERAVALDGRLAPARLQLGIVYDSESLPRRAVEQYRAAVRVNPALAAAHYRLAQDLARLGDRAEAAAELQAYSRLKSRSGKAN